MLLAVDIGNTNIDVGVFRDKELFRHWLMRAEKEKTCDEYKVTLLNLFSLSQVDVAGVKAVIISSVVPPLTPVFANLSQNLFRVKPMIVGPGLKTGMPILYENPMEVGADRVVGAIAAFSKYGGPCIVVDFGTATTFDAISTGGDYLGGAIAPGIQISAEALYLRTAKLPRIEIAKPKVAIGRTTVTSMHSGLFFGYIGLVSKVIDVINRELGGDAVTIATGGYSTLIGSEIEAIKHHEPFLVLEGLRILYEKNAG
ncbi:MAG: type III pantothenate kinase [Candidatus Aminicenantes bacterium]|nr:type III pantothenate kinase [Candidatus Aminicenantes bacterium]